MITRPLAYLETPAGRETQAKLWMETIAEMEKTDGRLSGVYASTSA